MAPFTRGQKRCKKQQGKPKKESRSGEEEQGFVDENKSHDVDEKIPDLVPRSSNGNDYDDQEDDDVPVVPLGQWNMNQVRPSDWKQKKSQAKKKGAGRKKKVTIMENTIEEVEVNQEPSFEEPSVQDPPFDIGGFTQVINMAGGLTQAMDAITGTEEFELDFVVADEVLAGHFHDVVAGDASQNL